MSKKESSLLGYLFEIQLEKALHEKFFENEDVKVAYDTIINHFQSSVKSAKRVGNHTSKQIGDLVLTLGDDSKKTLELKYTDKGKGTYHNTSLELLKYYGVESYSDFLRKQGYADFLENLLKDTSVKVKKIGCSFVTNKDSSYIRNRLDSFYYKTIQEEETKLRKQYTQSTLDSFRKNKEILGRLIKDLIFKVKSNLTYKGIADYYLYFCKELSEATIESKESLLERLLQKELDIKETESGFSLGEMTIQFGWQNGCGLNNPTIRVFVK